MSSEILKFFKQKSQILPAHPPAPADEESRGQQCDPSVKQWPESEAVSVVKPLFSVSQFLGIPGFSHLHANVSQGKLWVLNAWNAALISNEVVLILGHLNGIDDTARLLEPHVILFLIHIHAILVHLWSMIYSKKLSLAFKKYRETETILIPYRDGRDGRFSRIKGVATAVLYALFAIWYSLKPVFANVYYNRGTTYGSFKDYAELEPNPCPILPWVPIPSGFEDVYCLLSTLSTNFVWAFGDFVLLVLSITLAEMFRRLNKRIMAVQPEKLTLEEVEILREHHGLIASIVEEFDESVSVLNFINMIFNLTLLLTQDYSRVSARSQNLRFTDMDNFWAQYDAAAVVLKLMVGCIAAAFLHRRAHAPLRFVRTWPIGRDLDTDFSETNRRSSAVYIFLSQLSTPKIGFTIFNITTITAKFVSLMLILLVMCFAFNRIVIGIPGYTVIYLQNTANANKLRAGGHLGYVPAATPINLLTGAKNFTTVSRDFQNQVW